MVDPDPAASATADDLGVRWFAALDALLASDPLPDGAIIATPNALHREHAERCIAAGVPILVEKPIATSVTDGLAIAEAAAGAGVPLLVGHHRRHSPIITAARDVIRSGALGEVVAASTTTLFAKPAEYFEAAAWRREPGGGPILINLIHDVDALRHLIGEIVDVQALASSHVRNRPVEETVAVNLRFASGALGSLLLSDAAASPLSWELTAGEDPAFPRYPDHDPTVIAGSQGTLGLPSLRLLRYPEQPSWRLPLEASVVSVQAADPLTRQLEHFLRVIERRDAPLVSGPDAVESLRVTLAVTAAIASGATVSCAPPGLDRAADRS